MYSPSLKSETTTPDILRANSSINSSAAQKSPDSFFLPITNKKLAVQDLLGAG